MKTPDRSIDERKAAILRAIVSHYVRSGEPVGSKTIVERFPVNVSPATVRNEMAALEEAGYVYRPHASAGRVPTDAGYRYYVDEYAGDVRLPAPDARRVRSFFGEPHWELEDALRQTAALLSSLTDHAAVVFAPALDRSIVRHVELVRLGGNRAMLVLVADTGRVETHVVLVSESSDDEQLAEAAEMLNRTIGGVQLDDAASVILANINRFSVELREIAGRVARVLDHELPEHEGDRVFLEGASTIVDEQKFSDLETVRQVMGALEHKRVLLELVADALAINRAIVRIGSENPMEEMQSCAVITSAYGMQGNPLGSLGVVGPTRMDYRKAIAAVSEVSSYLGRMLTEPSL
jgi:heat-inducible transcriptional repressor